MALEARHVRIHDLHTHFDLICLVLSTYLGLLLTGI